MVLGQVEAVEASPVGQLEHAQALLVGLALAATRLVNPIEDPELNWLPLWCHHDGR